MRQRDFFKSRVENRAIYAAERVGPRLTRFYEQFKAVVEKSPRNTAVAMFLFAFVNFVLMVYIVYKKPAPSLIPKNLAKGIKEINGSKNNIVAFNLSNYIRISKLKDSLDYLVKLPRLTKSDSLLFIRICEEYTKLDPVFFKQLNIALHKNHNNSNHEKFNH